MARLPSIIVIALPRTSVPLPSRAFQKRPGSLRIGREAVAISPGPPHLISRLTNHKPLFSHVFVTSPHVSITWTFQDEWLHDASIAPPRVMALDSGQERSQKPLFGKPTTCPDRQSLPPSLSLATWSRRRRAIWQYHGQCSNAVSDLWIPDETAKDHRQIQLQMRAEER